MKIRYFAWVRERTGLSEEDVDPPAHVETAGDLLRWLGTRGEGYADVVERANVIRIAVDQVHATPDASVRRAREVALFPPMTGG